MTFRHWSRVTPYTSSCDFAECCVFVKQSPGPFHCASPGLFLANDPEEDPFSLSYGAIVPSSLTRVLSRALVSSTILPVSVLVRSPVPLARSFSWQRGVSQSGLSEDSPSDHLSKLPQRICQPGPPTGFDHHIHKMADLASCVTPLLRRGTGGTGILNLLSITYAFRPWLRGRLTLGGRTFPRKP